jgi:flagellar basal-body rod protein FlgC
MDASMAIAASGMAAASASLTSSACNIANMQTTGPIPASGPDQPVPQNSGSLYQAVFVTSQALPGGGVTSASSNMLPSYTLAYDPSAPFANLQGMVAAPNVDPIAETVNQISASAAFRANLAVFEAANKNFKTLLDTLA